MSQGRIARWRRSLEALFPERHLYVRSGGEMRAFTLTTNRQMMISGAVALAALWMGVTTAAMLIGAMNVGTVDQKLVEQRAYFERLNADRQARLNSAIAQLSDGSLAELADSIDKRQTALAQLFSEISGEPAPANLAAQSSPLDRVRYAQQDTERLITQAGALAKTRVDRLRLALRMAGLDPASYSRAGASELGGPFIGAKDPRALAAVLDVDEDFAVRIQHAALDMSALRSMNETVDRLPLARPTSNTRRASGFGVRLDPFTRLPALHSGVDFSGPVMSPVTSTAPGVVSFTGVRAGYGNTIEIDHGGGFKTRYAHLKSIGVARGQRVGLGQKIGGIGSTGRSTGPHLHYEVWVNGRAKNPDHFLKAGDYVQQTQ